MTDGDLVQGVAHLAQTTVTTMKGPTSPYTLITFDSAERNHFPLSLTLNITIPRPQIRYGYYKGSSTGEWINNLWSMQAREKPLSKKK